MAILRDSSTVDVARKRRIQELKSKILEKGIPKISPEIEAHFDSVPSRYFINISQEESCFTHSNGESTFEKHQESESVGSLQPIFDWKVDSNKGITTVNVITWDRAGPILQVSRSTQCSWAGCSYD